MGHILVKNIAYEKLVTVRFTFDDSHTNSETSAWYDTEHVPALARVPGVLCARRFRTSHGDPKYVALYHLVAPGVVDTPDWKQASASTPMPQPVRDQISNRLRLVCRNYVRS